MGVLLKSDGTEVSITPNSGGKFVFEGELYPMLDTDMIEIIHLHDGRIMLLDEEGKLKKPRKPHNPKATTLLHLAGGMDDDFIIGDVVILRKDEMR
jgi:hypothetical protein